MFASIRTLKIEPWKIYICIYLFGHWKIERWKIHICIYLYEHAKIENQKFHDSDAYRCLFSVCGGYGQQAPLNYRPLLQNLVSFVGLFCKRDLEFYRNFLTETTPQIVCSTLLYFKRLCGEHQLHVFFLFICCFLHLEFILVITSKLIKMTNSRDSRATLLRTPSIGDILKSQWSGVIIFCIQLGSKYTSEKFSIFARNAATCSAVS